MKYKSRNNKANTDIFFNDQIPANPNFSRTPNDLKIKIQVGNTVKFQKSSHSDKWTIEQELIWHWGYVKGRLFWYYCLYLSLWVIIYHELLIFIVAWQFIYQSSQYKLVNSKAFSAFNDMNE